MMFILQLVFCLSFVNICWGMDNQVIERWNVIIYKNSYGNYRNLISGKLQIYFVKKNNEYKPSARFIPDNNKEALVQINNFNDDMYQEVFKNNCVYIEEKGNAFRKTLQVTQIQDTNETEELLNMKGEFQIIVAGDNIILHSMNIERDYPLYNQYHIEAIRKELLLNKPFIINLCSMTGIISGKVKEWKSISSIWWKGWVPSLEETGCFTLQGIDDAKEINIWLNNEKGLEYYHTRNKWISRISMLAVLLLITYQLKDKIYNIGSLLK